ncbi:hypothetical protein ACROYT_G016742 [Oculina patagonica]
MSKERILSKVRNERLFGRVEVDICVSDHLKEKFSPIFNNTEISRADIGDFMKAFAEENNIMAQPCRSFIRRLKGEKILLATPLLKWYLEHGLEVGNSGYGKMITNQLKHRNVEYCSDAEACRKVNTPLFRKLENITEEMYEVESCKETIKTGEKAGNEICFILSQEHQANNHDDEALSTPKDYLLGSFREEIV